MLETHVCNNNIEGLNKFFGGYDLRWIAAKKYSKYGRAIGGCVIGIKKDLNYGNFQYNFLEIDEFIILKINVGNKVITILPLYIRSEDWSSTLTCLETLMMKNILINPILIGDFNIRIGNLQQVVDTELLPQFDTWTIFRKSKDTVINSKGSEFINFCSDYGLFVLNGCSKGDEEGQFTFVSGVGQSVNDICAVSQNILESLKYFSVESQTWSDHLPICVMLECKLVSKKSNSQKLLPKLWWDDKSCHLYRQNLDQNLFSLSPQSSELNLKYLTSVIKKSAPKLKRKNVHFVAKQKWFNSKCSNARQKTFKWLRKFQKSNSTSHRLKYINAKQNFRKVEKEAKRLYSEQLDNKINSVKNSKDWWKLAKDVNSNLNVNAPDISAERFKMYFEDLLNPPQVSNDIQYAHHLIKDQFLDRVITLDEVKLVIKKAKLNKAPGEDRITYEFFKNATEDFLRVLTSAYNILFEKGSIEKSFVETIIFPIHKKGDINQCCNYRGISFMNVVAKIMMGIITERLYDWVDLNNVLNEYQAGFRKGYSTMDNIYNLSAIVNLKFEEGKKVYAFFVDFKAAFDTVARKSLIYKLNCLGVSSKIVKFIEAVYKESISAVWAGEELSDFFSTNSGVKQGCILSPLLFALYLNDLHDCLGGGIVLDHLNVRLLMYADDIVILADDINIMQNMITKLEEYCYIWNLKVNLEKSEIMIFRKGGRIARNENWRLNGENIKIVSDYKYLGVILTPKMNFCKHIDNRNNLAKSSINTAWSNFLNRSTISLSSKWNIFRAVSRAIQTYGAQVWGFSCFDQVDSLQLYFLKRILKLPKFTPTYILLLETGAENNFFYTLNLHFTYIFNALFDLDNSRLPNILSKMLLAKNLFCFRELSNFQNKFEVFWNLNDLDRYIWKTKIHELICKMKISKYNEYLSKVANTNRIYKHLNIESISTYINNTCNPHQIMWIFKARCDLIELNATRFSEQRSKLCSMCNLREQEDVYHFLGKCPILKEFRKQYFDKIELSFDEIIFILNESFLYKKLVNYIIKALDYRKLLIEEFNY